jgi:hypothetical protein
VKADVAEERLRRQSKIRTLHETNAAVIKQRKKQESELVKEMVKEVMT